MDMVMGAAPSGGEVWDAQRATDALVSIQLLLEGEKAEPDEKYSKVQVAGLEMAVKGLKQFIASEIMEGDSRAPMAKMRYPEMKRG